MSTTAAKPSKKQPPLTATHKAEVLNALREAEDKHAVPHDRYYKWVKKYGVQYAGQMWGTLHRSYLWHNKPQEFNNEKPKDVLTYE